MTPRREDCLPKVAQFDSGFGNRTAVRKLDAKLLRLDARYAVLLQPVTGILLPGLTIEEMKQGASRIRNPVIARMFKELNLIEQWGTGVRRIFKEAGELGLPEPKIEEIALRLRFTVYLAKLYQIQTRTTEQAEAQVDMRILQACAKRSLSSAEIASSLGHKTLSGNVRKALPALQEAGLLKYTIPDKPDSRLQKYRLTEKGKSVLEGGK